MHALTIASNMIDKHVAHDHSFHNYAPFRLYAMIRYEWMNAWMNILEDSCYENLNLLKMHFFIWKWFVRKNCLTAHKVKKSSIMGFWVLRKSIKSDKFKIPISTQAHDFIDLSCIYFL